MNVTPRIIRLEPKSLIGISQGMSLVNTITFELWKGYRERGNEITNTVF